MTDVRSEVKECSPAKLSGLKSEEQDGDNCLELQASNNTKRDITDTKHTSISYLSPANISMTHDVKPTVKKMCEQQSQAGEDQNKAKTETAQCTDTSPVSSSKADNMAVDQEMKKLKQSESLLTGETLMASSGQNQTGNHIFVPDNPPYSGWINVTAPKAQISAASVISKSQPVISSTYVAQSVSPVKKQQLSNLIPQTVLEHMSDNEEPTESTADSDVKKILNDEHNLVSCGNDPPLDERQKTSNSLVGAQLAERQSYESDMDCSSDSEDRLVMDNDSVSDETAPGDETSEEERLHGNVVKSEASIVANKTEPDVNTTATSDTVKHSSRFPVQLLARTVENTSSQSQTVIPSVVNDMAPTVEHRTEFQATHGKNKELKSLPADLRMPFKQVFSTDDSLLKMNKPTIGLHVLQPRHPFEPRPHMLFQESSSVPKSGMIGAKNLTSGPEGSQRLYSHDSSDRRDKADNYRILQPETKMKKEKPIPSENADMNKDSLTSEEQVNAVIKKYHLANSPEKREVSVKDMRRVIPQLIMCLYSKEDHHARKVKGLWEKKPNNWPSDIPYCDPNNSNRGGDTVGKPKKETLHKMFDYLISQYLEKMHVKNTTSIHIPYPQGSTPHYRTVPPSRNIKDEIQATSSMLSSSNISNYFVLPQEMSPLRQVNAAQPSVGPSKYPTSKSASFPGTADGTLTILGKADLRPVVQNIFSTYSQKQIPSFQDVDKEELRKESDNPNINSHLSDTQIASSCKTNQTPAAKRQKTDLDEQTKVKCNLDQRKRLPTVVDLHSPVKVDDETDVSNMPNTSVHLVPPLSVQNSACVMSSAKPLSSLLRDTRGVFGTSDNVESQGEKCTSLPNIALMMSHQNMVIGGDHVRPLQTVSGMPLHTTEAPIVSSVQPFVIDSLPKSSPFTAQMPSMLTLFSDVQFLTSQAHPGVPIIPVSDFPQYQSSPSSISGQQPLHSDKTVVVSPVHLRDNSKQLYFTNHNAARKECPAESTENELPSSHSSQNGTDDAVPVLGNQVTEVHLSNMRQCCAATAEYTEAKISKQSVISNDKRTNVELKKDDHLRQTQNADLQAASAILMLSKTPVVSSGEKISKSEPPPKPVYGEIEDCAEPKTECHSIDSDYHSMSSASLMDNLYQVTGSSSSQKELPQETSVATDRSLFLSVLNQPSSGVDGSTSTATSIPITSSQKPFLSPNVRLTSHVPQVASKLLTSDLTTSSSAVSHHMASSNCTESIIRTSTNVISSTSDAHHQVISPSVSPTATVTSGIHPIRDMPLRSTALLNRMSSTSTVATSHQMATDQIKDQLPSPSSQAQTSSKESYDRPLSLVVPHQHTDGKEHFLDDVMIEEARNPIQEIMNRIQEKLLIVENLHQARKFRERDLSLLLLVLDLLKQKQDSLDEHNRVEFILTCHRLEATFDVAILEKHVPDSLRQDWRDYQEKNYFEVNRRRSSVIPPTDAHVFRLSTTQEVG